MRTHVGASVTRLFWKKSHKITNNGAVALIFSTPWDVLLFADLAQTDQILALKSLVLVNLLWKHFLQPGIDVMITIFCDFRQFSAKKIGVFLKNQWLWSKFCIFQLCFESKTPIFSWIFQRKFLQNHNIGPWSPWFAHLGTLCFGAS
jgi:hypothetical protein